ncbi:hypothetical protein AGDE_07080 [Angomonas deanei]|nr:hypothetical protein AGDE_07080 [Angomonas deanei]|eukprot:EPY36105.1 hypothetical protein AGDE_07080 [Angomonas deanei]
MRESARTASQMFRDAFDKETVDDPSFKGKVATLSASVKAYNTRLANLQNEARSIQSEVDSLLKLMWGTESPRSADFSSPPTAKVDPVAESSSGFEVDPPIAAKVTEEKTNKAAPSVEQVEAEPVTEPIKKASNDPGVTEEIEVESIEVEVEPEPEAAPASDPAETMKITDITRDLYERGVNFSDCLDAKSLRQRYRDVLSGKVASSVSQSQYSAPSSAASTQPKTAQRPPSYQQQQQQQYQAPPNTNESGITSDPYPNAQRKMVDPMKYVREVKQEIAMEKGIDANTVDLWSGKVKLEDHKRLYDYPSIQSYPIEVRQKGDIPR